MKDPILRFFELLGIEIFPLSKDDPYPWKYPMEYSDDFRIPHENGDIYWQHFKGTSYCQDVYELDFEKNTALPYAIKHKNFYFAFHLGGEDIIIRNSDGEIIDIIRENTYFPAYYCNGDYQVEFKEGKTIVCSVVFRSRWPRDNFRKFKYMDEVVKAATLKSDENISLMPLELSKILNNLEKIFKLKGQLGEIRGISKSIYTKIAHQYNDQAFAKFISDTLPWNLFKDYIERNFCERKLDFKKFADDHNIEYQALRRNFKNAFKIAPYDYFIWLKMQMARIIIRSKDGASFTKISREIGYSSKNFSTQYKRTFGYPPTEEGLYDETPSES